MIGWSSYVLLFLRRHGYCVIKDQGTTWGTIEYLSSLEFILAALYSCNFPVNCGLPVRAMIYL